MSADHSDQVSKGYVTVIRVGSNDGCTKSRQGSQNPIQQRIKTGLKMRRVKRGQIGRAKLVELLDNNEQLRYHTSGRWNIIPSKPKTVNINELVEVRSGFTTDRLQKAAKKISFRQTAAEENCVSLIIQKHRKNKQKTIDFVAENLTEKEAFVSTLQAVLDKEHAKQSVFNERQWVIDKFHAADINHDGKLNFHEIWLLLKEMNLNIDLNYAKALFRDVDAANPISGSIPDGGLDQEGFLKFFLKLTFHFEVSKIMRLYSSSNEEALSAADLAKFLVEVQGFEGIDSDMAALIIDEIITKQGTYRLEKSNKLLGPVGFRTLLRSRWGNIMRSGHENVFQDMNQPLSHYYVNSSHNTYLMGIQVKGGATVEGYINAIKRGARLLEHVLDGAHGEPCITHRNTLVASILLKDALHAIKKYAFQYSPYPLILTIENHCSIQQQGAMARTFIEVLGDDIYLVPEGEPLTELPSPNQLKNKYLLRGKSGLARKISSTNISGSTEDEYELGDELTSTVSENPIIDSNLSRLISLPQMKLHSLLANSGKYPANSSTSISETKLQKLFKYDETFATHTSRYFTRSYPKGLRQDSSNYCPVPGWILGIQSVALNMQTHDENMDLNSGLFRINGNCGYVLKPSILIRGLDPVRTDCSLKLVLYIVIISAQYLPKPSCSEDSEIIDPYVITEIYGIPADCIKFRTQTISNNGFCPVWNEEFKIELRSPETALLRFCIMDHDMASADDFIGEFSIPVTSIRKGYSIVSLNTGHQRVLDPSAALVIHANFEEIHHF